MKPAGAPRRGELVWLDFSPQSGHDQAGRCPALVVSSGRYNQRTGLMLACPITSQSKGYPFEVPLPAGLGIGGVVLADHGRSLDWRARNAEGVSKVDAVTLDEVCLRLAALIGSEI